jgi:hypothetical protein
MSAAPLGLYIGNEPPANPSPTVRWLSTSHQHLQVPSAAIEKTPIMGTNTNLLPSNCQEFSPWFNATLNRYEALVNVSNTQYFVYATDPRGPWTSLGKVLGGGSGGEASNAQQCSIFIYQGSIYAVYITGVTTIVKCAVATLPSSWGSAPSFSSLGTIYTDTGSNNGTARVVFANGVYYMFAERDGAGGGLRLASTTATPPNWATTPFTMIAPFVVLPMSVGVRQLAFYGRPFPVYESASGTWIIYAHVITSVEFGWCGIGRWISLDGGYPVNWTFDSLVISSTHPFECDQTADFAACQGPGGQWQAFWSANNNVASAFCIMTAPMIEPMLAWTGNGWVRQSAGKGADELVWINPDTLNAATQTTQNLWDLVCDTGTTTITVTLPRAASNSKIKISNYPSALPGNPIKLVQNASDLITSDNQIVSMSAASTTVTVTTRKPHGLTTSDFVTITGATPTAYNITNAAVASVPSATSFTYTAGSAPGTNTTLGWFDYSLWPGESRQYRAALTLGNKTWFRF